MTSPEDFAGSALIAIKGVSGNECLNGSDGTNACDTEGSLSLLFNTATPSIPSDYKLKTGAIAIDKGKSSFDYIDFKIEDLVKVDFDGKTRTSPYYMGAFENN